MRHSFGYIEDAGVSTRDDVLALSEATFGELPVLDGAKSGASAYFGVASCTYECGFIPYGVTSPQVLEFSYWGEHNNMLGATVTYPPVVWNSDVLDIYPRTTRDIGAGSTLAEVRAAYADTSFSEPVHMAMTVPGYADRAWYVASAMSDPCATSGLSFTFDGTDDTSHLVAVTAWRSLDACVGEEGL